MKSRWSRRDFLKSTAAFMALGTAQRALGAQSHPTSLPRRRLGKTGEMVSVVGFGSGSRFCSIQDEDAALALLERAFELGVNYFDTAASYTRHGPDGAQCSAISQPSRHPPHGADPGLRAVRAAAGLGEAGGRHLDEGYGTGNAGG